MKGDAAAVQPQDNPPVIALICLASVSALGYAVLLWLSWQFGSDTPAQAKPTIWMLSIFGGLFIAYWSALRLAVRLPDTKWLLGGIFAAACLFRGITLPSIPMHEIDIYRYLWDGAVLAEGVSPYRYSPEQILHAVEAGGTADDATLHQLVELAASSDSLGESLDRIHYGHYPSPYPIVSQAIFALSAKLTPAAATLHARLVILKSLLVLADLATLVVVMLLLRDVGMHAGWSLAYGWCPLMMKEVANGGHLDSIAVFLTTLAIWLLVRSTRANKNPKTRVSIAAGALAFAIGAKLYPVVLVPLFAAVWMRRSGWEAVGVGLATTTLLSALLLHPLLGPSEKALREIAEQEGESSLEVPGQLNDPAANLQAGVEAGPQPHVEADDGIEAFLNHWEMNDFIYLVVLENLRQQEEVSPEKKPWFVFTSDEWSRSVVTDWANLKRSLRLSDGPAVQDEQLTASQLKRESFSLARMLTGGAFALYACLLAWLAAGKNNPHAWCRAAMLTLAWFWLTCPTQNPWYWCWVLPLLPFARYRTWHVVAAATMLYYLRFWLTAHYPDPNVLGTPYNGTYFFYFVVAWVEFLPVLIALFVESVWFWRMDTKLAAANVGSEE